MNRVVYSNIKMQIPVELFSNNKLLYLKPKMIPNHALKIHGIFRLQNKKLLNTPAHALPNLTQMAETACFTLIENNVVLYKILK